MLSGRMRTSLLALAAALLPSPLLADTLINNVNGIQAGPDGKLEHFGALLIGNDGKVKGLPGDAFRSDTIVIDGRGRTLLPGFVDAHGHVMELGFSALQLDLVGTSSLLLEDWDWN